MGSGRAPGKRWPMYVFISANCQQTKQPTIKQSSQVKHCPNPSQDCDQRNTTSKLLNALVPLDWTMRKTNALCSEFHTNLPCTLYRGPHAKYLLPCARIAYLLWNYVVEDAPTQKTHTKWTHSYKPWTHAQTIIAVFTYCLDLLFTGSH